MFSFKRMSAGDTAISVINGFLLLLVSLVTLYPFYYIIVLAFNDGNDTVRGGIYLWPRLFTLDNFKEFFGNDKWTTALFVTAARTVIGTAIGVFFTSIVSYGLSKKQLVGRKIYINLLVVAMYCSGGLIPYYIVLRSLNLLNSFLVYVIPGALSMFFVMVAISFFADIPAELVESAYLDGSGDLSIFIRIVLPVSLPLLATMTLFIGVGHWNSWVDSAYFVRDNNLRTLAYRMREVINQSMRPEDPTSLQYMSELPRVTTQSLQMAAMIVATGPILFVYPFLQKYFAKGIMLGAVKG